MLRARKNLLGKVLLLIVFLLAVKWIFYNSNDSGNAERFSDPKEYADLPHKENRKIEDSNPDIEKLNLDSVKIFYLNFAAKIG